MVVRMGMVESMKREFCEARKAERNIWIYYC